MTGISVLLGALPFAFGGALNWYLLSHAEAVLPYRVIGIGFLLIWGGLGFLLNGKGMHTKKTVLALNLIPFADLVLLAVQELVLREYWRGSIGIWSQLFYLPMVNLGATLTSWSHSMFAVYAVSFLLMVCVSYAGGRLRKKNKG